MALHMYTIEKWIMGYSAGHCRTTIFSKPSIL